MKGFYLSHGFYAAVTFLAWRVTSLAAGWAAFPGWYGLFAKLFCCILLPNGLYYCVYGLYPGTRDYVKSMLSVLRR